MKRVIALSFLFLANVILLAHVVIPHHHHHLSTVCFLNSHCADCKEAHKQSSDSDCHHDDGNKREECPLQEIYVRIENNQSLVDLTPDNDLQYPALSLFSTTPIVEIIDLKSLPFRQKPYLRSYHTDYTSQSLGLRAPPYELGIKN